MLEACMGRARITNYMLMKAMLGLVRYCYGKIERNVSEFFGILC